MSLGSYERILDSDLVFSFPFRVSLVCWITHQALYINQSWWQSEPNYETLWVWENIGQSQLVCTLYVLFPFLTICVHSWKWGSCFVKCLQTSTLSHAYALTLLRLKFFSSFAMKHFMSRHWSLPDVDPVIICTFFVLTVVYATDTWCELEHLTFFSGIPGVGTATFLTSPPLPICWAFCITRYYP